MELSLEDIETQLQFRWKYPYHWGRKQNDAWDKNSRFIYDTPTWDDLVRKMKTSIEKHQYDKTAFFQYAANRWYNFLSAIAVEHIFTSIDRIEPALNHKDRLVDFNLFGTNFDHKTSVFPKGFQKTLVYAQNHKEELLYWLYKNQSQQGRKHHENRLFIMVYASDGNHWKLKAEITWLKSIILNYVATFEASKLIPLEFSTNKTAVSDIIWAIK